MWILTNAFFAETFQPMNAAVTFQIGLSDCARAILAKFTFAGAWESFQGIRTVYTRQNTLHFIILERIPMYTFVYEVHVYKKGHLNNKAG